MSESAPSFDLVVATVGRSTELGRFLDSIEAQEYPRVRVIVVDQNEDDRLEAVLDGRSLDLVRLRSQPGLSRARNAALSHLHADVVAFPDDDCSYPRGLLSRVGERLGGDPSLDGLSGRAEDVDGRSSPSWKAGAALLTTENMWNRAISFAIFLRREVVERVGPFDERLGLGSGQPSGSGEETDYVIRALRSGARIEYDPSLVVLHDVRDDDSRIGYRDGASLGYLLRKHHYPARTVARMLVRPLGGALLSLLRVDTRRAHFHAATLLGRARGYRSAARRP